MNKLERIYYVHKEIDSLITPLTEKGRDCLQVGDSQCIKSRNFKTFPFKRFQNSEVMAVKARNQKDIPHDPLFDKVIIVVVSHFQMCELLFFKYRRNCMFQINVTNTQSLHSSTTVTSQKDCHRNPLSGYISTNMVWFAADSFLQTQ